MPSSPMVIKGMAIYIFDSAPLVMVDWSKNRWSTYAELIKALSGNLEIGSEKQN